MTFNIFNSVILAGIIQGFVFGIVVLTSKKYRSASTIALAALILSFSLDNIQYYLEDIGLISELQLMGIYFIPFELLSAPLFLLYGLHLLNPERQFTRRDFLWFVPFLLSIIISSQFKIAFANAGSSKQTANFFYNLESVLECISIIFDTAVLLFLSYSASRYNKYKISLQRDFAPQLNWFKFVLVSLLILNVIWAYITFEDYYYGTEYWYVIYIAMSAIIYWMGHIGIYKYGVQEQRKKIRHYAMEHASVKVYENRKNEHITAFENLIVGQERFLDPGITLEKVTEELNISKSHLSRMINTELQTSFPDYINNLRVEKAKTYLNHPEFANYTLVAIGLEAGFASKTTFNNAFKKATGLTPSEFKKSKAIEIN